MNWSSVVAISILGGVGAFKRNSSEYGVRISVRLFIPFFDPQSLGMHIKLITLLSQRPILQLSLSFKSRKFVICPVLTEVLSAYKDYR